jgi:OOP family OmpA-OmpF porin
MRIRAVLLAVALAVTPDAASALPKTLRYVDPQAPCFRWPAVDMDGDGVFDRVDHCVNTPRGCVVDAYGCQTDGDGDGVCDGIDRCPSTPAGEKVDEYGCSGEPAPFESESPSAPAPAPESPPSAVEKQLVETGHIRIENVYFESGAAKLLPESETMLQEVGRILAKYPALRIEIQGHTDTRGRAALNQRLSQERAEAVREYLLANYRLEPSHYVARGYGETRPETRERNDEELLRNRRVVLEVLNPEVLPRGVKLERKE